MYEAGFVVQRLSLIGSVAPASVEVATLSGWKPREITGCRLANQTAKVAKRSGLHGFVTSDGSSRASLATGAAATSMSVWFDLTLCKQGVPVSRVRKAGALRHHRDDCDDTRCSN
jgi:hypothetical protein